MNSSIMRGSVSTGVSTAWYPKDYSITRDLPQPHTPGKRGGVKRRVSWPEAPVSDLRFVPLDCESNQDRRALFYQRDDYQRFKRDWERERGSATRDAAGETESLGFPFLGILLIIPLLIPCIMIKGILGAFLTQVSVVDHLSTTTTTAAATATSSSPWWHDPFCLLGLWHIGQQHETDCAFQSSS